MISGLISPHSDVQTGETMGHWGSTMCYMRSKSSVGDKDIQIWKSRLAGKVGGFSRKK